MKKPNHQTRKVKGKTPAHITKSSPSTKSNPIKPNPKQNHTANTNSQKHPSIYILTTFLHNQHPIPKHSAHSNSTSSKTIQSQSPRNNASKNFLQTAQFCETPLITNKSFL